MALLAPVRSAPLPDPVVWTARLVEVVSEARRGTRPWKQVYPLLDLPVLAEVWRRRKVRHAASWRVATVHSQSTAPGVWELVVLVREDLRFRAIAVRMEAAAHSGHGHLGPPGRRLTPLSRLHPDHCPEGWIATAFAIL